MSQVITHKCQVKARVNISSESMSSNSSANINCRITQYKKMVSIQEIGTITEK